MKHSTNLTRLALGITWIAVQSFSVQAIAVPESYYRQNPLGRLAGANQGRTGSCEAEADTAALEGVFSMRGMRVRLSSYYRLAYNIRNTPNRAMYDSVYDQGDADFVNRVGPIVPDYMWPEDGQGLNAFELGLRPHVVNNAVVDPEWPNANTMGFSKSYYTINPGKPHSVTVPWIKEQLVQGKAMTLSYASKILYYGFDHRTGLLTRPYSKMTFESEMLHHPLSAADVRHTSTIVGYDDTLYSEHGYSIPGALIIRNSWNSNSNLEATAEATDELIPQLQKFRFKLNPAQNLPGYYAIPMQFVVDLAQTDTTTIRVLDLNYEAFQTQYERFRRRYVTKLRPFVCETETPASPEDEDQNPILNQASTTARTRIDRIEQYLSQAASSTDLLRRNILHTSSRELIRLETYDRAWFEERVLREDAKPIFYYAKFASHPGMNTDRSLAFGSPESMAFYCNSEAARPFPSNLAMQRPNITESTRRLAASPNSLQYWTQFFSALITNSVTSDQ